MLRFKSLLLVSALAFMLVIVGCSNEESPTQAVQNQESDIPADVQQQMQLADQYERLIEAMDPYVTEGSDGQFTFYEAGFVSQHGSLPASDQQIVNQLRDGITIVNAEIGKDRSGQPNALGSYCNYYWWGKKCCYWGDQAQQLIFAMTVGSGISGFGLLAGYAGWAQYLVWKYGMFCLNGMWGGPVWLTAS